MQQGENPLGMGHALRLDKSHSEEKKHQALAQTKHNATAKAIATLVCALKKRMREAFDNDDKKKHPLIGAECGLSVPLLL